MGRRVGNSYAELKAPTRHFVQVGRHLRKLVDCLRIDRRDRGGEGNALGRERQAEALRHVAVLARNRDAGEAAPLDLASEIERVTTIAERSRQLGTRGAISFFQWSLSYTALYCASRSASLSKRRNQM